MIKLIISKVKAPIDQQGIVPGVGSRATIGLDYDGGLQWWVTNTQLRGIQSAQLANLHYGTLAHSSQQVRFIQRDYKIYILTEVVKTDADILGDLRLSESMMVNSTVVYNSLDDTITEDASLSSISPRDILRNSSPI